MSASERGAVGEDDTKRRGRGRGGGGEVEGGGGGDTASILLTFANVRAQFFMSGEPEKQFQPRVMINLHSNLGRVTERRGAARLTWTSDGGAQPTP